MKVLRKKGTFDIFQTRGPTSSLQAALDTEQTWGDHNTESTVLAHYGDVPGGPWELIPVSQARRELEEFKLKALAAQPIPKDMALTPPPPAKASFDMGRLDVSHAWEIGAARVAHDSRNEDTIELVVRDKNLSVREAQKLVQFLNVAIAVSQEYT